MGFLSDARPYMIINFVELCANNENAWNFKDINVDVKKNIVFIV